MQREKLHKAGKSPNFLRNDTVGVNCTGARVGQHHEKQVMQPKTTAMTS